MTRNNSTPHLVTWGTFLLIGLGIGGCSHHKHPAPLTPPEPVRIKDDGVTSSSLESASSVAPGQEWQVYKGDAVYRLGKPYKVNGIWYFPAENMKYDEIGFASWYGDKFHNHLTANGEIFDKNGLTAAHKTLPLPSVVRVTNLDNNTSVIVRVNDRGPFANDRLIDLSERAAQILGCPSTGTLKVRVEILPNESLMVAQELRDRSNPVPLTPLVESAPLNAPIEAPPAETAAPSPDMANDLFDAPSEAPNAVQETTAPIADEPSEPSPPPSAPDFQLVAPPPTKTFVVQVGTFKNQQNAATLSQKLGIAGPTSVTPLSRQGETLYRVQSGPFADKNQAQNALHHAKSLGIRDAKILEKTT